MVTRIRAPRHTSVAQERTTAVTSVTPPSTIETRATLTGATVVLTAQTNVIGNTDSDSDADCRLLRLRRRLDLALGRHDLGHA